MKICLIDKQDSDRLILLFAGWGMDSSPFTDLSYPGYDIAVTYDYRNSNSFDIPAIQSYREVCIVAWSFGVIAAANFISCHPNLPVTAKIAVNGTLHPVDDSLGIPVDIFNGTLRTLSPATLSRFNRRMCGGSQKLKIYNSHLPDRDIAGLSDELRAIASLPHRPELKHIWDIVWISDNDLIIPTANQHAAWSGHSDVRIIEGSHLPDFNEIFCRSIVNKNLVANRFNQAALSYETHAGVQRAITDILSAKLFGYLNNKKPNNILEIGAGTGFMTYNINDLFPEAALTLWDLSEISPSLPGKHCQCDAESQIMHHTDNNFDLITSASTIQWFNSDTSFIRHAYKTLTHGGTIAISTFGPDNFTELVPYLIFRPHYHPSDQWISVLGNEGFTQIEVTESKEILNFKNSRSLLEHIRLTGVNATSASTSSVRKLLSSGISTLTYHPVYILASKP